MNEAQENFEVLPLSCEGASIFGEIKLALRNKRGISGQNSKKHNIDLMFAAEALMHRCIFGQLLRGLQGYSGIQT